MPIATEEALLGLEREADARRASIRESADMPHAGRVFYVAASGNDASDGKSPDTAWQTLARVSSAALCPGDHVLLRRGDIFRGQIHCKSGVTYGAYGEGEKPHLYSHERDMADPALWELYDEKSNIWRYKDPILDVGTLWIDGGRLVAYKHVPSYTREGRFVVRDEPTREFVITREFSHDLDFYWHFDAIMTTRPYGGEDFPIPEVTDRSLGTLYLRSNRGNPGYAFASIEAAVRRTAIVVGGCDGVHVDNLAILYYGWHGIAAVGERVRGLKVTSCEIGYIGGVIHSYYGCDPNYPEGGRGTIGRLGNAVEIYGGCDDYTVEGCYVHDCYDAGLTHQVTTNGRTIYMTSIVYKNNLIERCVYGIEYFLDMTEGDAESYLDGVLIEGNMIRHSGEGWGQQRHNTHTPAHIKGWSFKNAAKNFVIRGNIFDRAGRRSLHLVAFDAASCPVMQGNTYVQYEGGLLGKRGGNAGGEPQDILFDTGIEEAIRTAFGDTEARVYTVKKGGR